MNQPPNQITSIIPAGPANFGSKIRIGFHVSCLLLALPILLWANQAVAWELGGGLGYESRYISEGSNTLDHGGLVTLELELEHETKIGNFFAGIEFLTGAAVDFRETELALGYERAVGDFTAGLSYVRIIEEEDDEKEYDSELVAGISYDGWGHMTPSVEWVHSTEADGGLLVLALEGEVEIGEQSLVPYLLADVDYGYVSEDYDGLNHIEVGVAWETALSDIDVTIHAAYSIAQENLRREDEDNDYFWAGINFSL